MSRNSHGSDPFSLSGKTFLVAGGTRGIGKAISLHFARAGAKVVANYLRNEQTAKGLAEIAAEESLSISLCRADLTNEKGLEAVERSVEEAGPGLAGFVFCAATGIHKPAGELTERHFDWTFSLNVRAFFCLMKRLTPRF